MNSRLRCALLNLAGLGLAVLSAALIAPSAFADGLPVLGIDVGSKGVISLRGDVRYVTLATARGATTVARISVHSGRVLAFRRLAGNLTIPAVAYDGSASGLSADGKTLVLIEPRRAFPRARTTLAVVDPGRLQLRRRITLPGDFSFDAISQDGQTMFLIQYTSAKDPNRYNVRAFDLARGTLIARPVVDPHEPDEVMRGAPITRLNSAEGRWAYTLYDGSGKTPFVHALDTRTRTARCVDLPMIRGRTDLWTLRLHSAGGEELAVGKGRQTVALINRQNFGVSTPEPPVAGGGQRSWRLLLWGCGGLVGIAVIGAALMARRKAREDPAEILVSDDVARSS
jgi:hypothetical protein